MAHRFTLLVTASIALLAIAGCNRGPAMKQVSGTVTYKGGKAPTGELCVIRFEPTPNSTAEVRKAASSGINPDGTFNMNTRQAGDGVHVGEYAVTFVIAKSMAESKSLVAPKYTRAATTPFTVTVDRNISDLKFEIEPSE
jgi:hypothetical protein